MNSYQKWTSFYTMLRKDVVRMMRIWTQTFLPSVITSVLYFLIFGSVLGDRIGGFGEHSYVQFVIPGLVMLAVVTNAFSNTAFTFFTSKFFSRNIDEILVSPTPVWVMIAGFIAGGVVRGVIIGLLVLVVSLLFAAPAVANFFVILIFLILSSILFALGGLINGIYAKNFDGIQIVPTFVLTPLVYLGGVFYSVHILPEWWQTLTYINPIFYLINGFRYGFLGIADVSLWVSFTVLFVMIAVFIVINWYLIRTGLGLKQ
ncbi:MAG: ABC transporter permease [Patescibacteria group bacterium]